MKRYEVDLGVSPWSEYEADNEEDAIQQVIDDLNPVAELIDDDDDEEEDDEAEEDEA